MSNTIQAILLVKHGVSFMAYTAECLETDGIPSTITLIGGVSRLAARDVYTMIESEVPVKMESPSEVAVSKPGWDAEGTVIE